MEAAMSKSVQIEVKSVYGVELIYPANDEAKLFTSLSGKKTLSRQDLKIIKALGFDVEQVVPEFAV